MVDIAKVLKYLKKAYKLYKKHKQKENEGQTEARESQPGAEFAASAGGTDDANKWKLTNIGGIGSNEDAALRKKAAEGEAEFAGAGEKLGIEIWRIEKFNPCKQSIRAGNVCLYEGDAYIVLVTSKKPDTEELEWTLHFWLGSTSTQDEQGSAAYFCVNIDDKLNGKPVQHRETQGHESQLFMSHFESVTYLQGGCDSGFVSVEPTSYKPRLLHVKGCHANVRVSQVPLQSSYITHGDVFILDNGLKLFQFNGRSSNASEKRRAMEIVEQDIQAERNGLPELCILDGDEALECKEFWDIIGDQPDVIQEGTITTDEEAAQNDDVNFESEKQLFRVTDESGELVLSLESKGLDLSRSLVNNSDIWCISCTSQLFVYIGDDASKDERFYVTQNVSEVLKAAELLPSAPVTLLNGANSEATWSRFFN